MNLLLQPVSRIMTTNLVTVNPADSLEEVDTIFSTRRIHHLPVVRYTTIVGIISKSDVLLVKQGATKGSIGQEINEMKLKKMKAEDIMTKGMAKVSSDTRINVVLEIFKENLFHAIPVVDDDKLVGMITTFDIIKMLANFSKVDVPEDEF